MISAADLMILIRHHHDSHASINGGHNPLNALTLKVTMARTESGGMLRTYLPTPNVRISGSLNHIKNRKFIKIFSYIIISYVCWHDPW